MGIGILAKSQQTPTVIASPGISFLINLSNTIEIFSVFIIDVITLIHLRLSNSKPANTQSNTTSFNSRAVEVRLYKQAFSQSLPLLITLVCFAFITPQLTDDFTKFLTTTFVWHLAHGFDGLIIDLFHTRKELFFKKTVIDRSMATSSSFALTTTI
ncbi:hypothetical protein PRIPAC_81425 [Pristionchus pacificus]|uniref:G protein-coupled receptor n=1 Tax=Pristionchus pacificus TaxID=54126 RepID=A0A2A6CQ44_PRIPA|nr:hypothetical protein PRIPAC_81425 [Pristionchus pacificus]|eukprot:PDM80208.1 G protein-coupled receptor [Pristionchus pacificus]